MGCEVDSIPDDYDHHTLCDGMVGYPPSDQHGEVDEDDKAIPLMSEGLVDPVVALFDLVLNLLEVPPLARVGLGIWTRTTLPCHSGWSLSMCSMESEVDAFEDVHAIDIEEHSLAIKLLAVKVDTTLTVEEAEHGLELALADANGHDLYVDSATEVF